MLTPIAKSALSAIATDVANECLQIHGGHGYIRETGVEQLVRDARILSIDEGTNAVQARDLVARKLPSLSEAVDELTDEAATAAMRVAARPSTELDAEPLAAAVDALKRTTNWMRAQHERGDLEAALTGASDYLDLFALVLIGAAWARMAVAVDDGLEPDFRERKLATARVFFARAVARASSL